MLPGHPKHYGADHPAPATMAYCLALTILLITALLRLINT